jgi:hypothetical protein
MPPKDNGLEKLPAAVGTQAGMVRTVQYDIEDTVPTVCPHAMEPIGLF